MKTNERKANEWLERRVFSTHQDHQVVCADSILDFARYLDSLKSKEEKPKVERITIPDANNLPSGVGTDTEKAIIETLKALARLGEKINELVDHANKDR